MALRSSVRFVAWVLVGISLIYCSPMAKAQEQVTVNASAPAHPFPHFWEQMFGSGHAILALRESYLSDLRAVKQVTDFHYVRFHAILDDEVGVYKLDEHGNPIYNFAYVDQIYDNLLKNHVRPLVEISFMPKQLAFNPDDLQAFWYKPNVSPPKSWDAWDGLMTHFAQHLVDRYGIDEVSQWYFEVWNEPNIDFWGGIPRQESYFELYAHTAHDLKMVSPRLRVGGPATAAASWVPAFLQYMAQNHVPVDFVSTHGYADDTTANLFGKITSRCRWISASAWLLRRYARRLMHRPCRRRHSSGRSGTCRDRTSRGIQHLLVRLLQIQFASAMVASTKCRSGRFRMFLKKAELSRSRLRATSGSGPKAASISPATMGSNCCMIWVRRGSITPLTM